MMDKKALLIFLLTIPFLFSCASFKGNIKKKRTKSFRLVQTKIKLKICLGDLCAHELFESSASGVVVRRKGQNLTLTAGHVCDLKYIAKRLSVERPFARITFEDVAWNLTDDSLNKYSGTPIKINIDKDLCLIKSEGMPGPPVPISRRKIIRGEEVFNLAAPTGIFTKNMVLILDGTYSGYDGESDIYTIPAEGGSSGSPVFNKRGELVGMIHSVFRRFKHASLSAAQSDLRNFIFDH